MVRRRPGYLMILALLGLATLFFVATLYLQFLAGQRSLSRGVEWSVQAEAAAMAGIEDGMAALATSGGWTTGFASKPLSRSGATYTVTFDRTNPSVPFSTNNAAGTAAVQGYEGRVVPPGSVHLVSVGRAGQPGAAWTEQVLLRMAPATLYESAFNLGGSPPTGWTEITGRYFSVSGGQYSMGKSAGSDNHDTLVGNSTWTDYVVDVNASAVSGPNGQGLGILVRATADPATGFTGGYIVTYDPKDDQRAGGSFAVATVSVSGSSGTQVARVTRSSTALAGLPSGWEESVRPWKVEVSGSRITLTANGQQVLAADLSTLPPDQQFGSGKAGIFASQQTVVEVASVKVTTLSGKAGVASWW